jgi:hypothetical protein
LRNLGLIEPYRNLNFKYAGDWLKKKDVQGALIPVKGSRSMQMEKVLGNIDPTHL